MTGPMLSVTDMSVAYGKMPALRNITFQVEPGEALGIVGTNSAGKTTLARALATRSHAFTTTGSGTFADRNLFSSETKHRLRAGLRLVPQGRQLFPNLSVRHNLKVSCRVIGVPMESALERALTWFPEVFDRRIDELAGNLSGGEQQMVSIARTIVGTPQMIIFDEPALGLSEGMSGRVRQIIARLHESGITVMVCDQTSRPWRDNIQHWLVLQRGEIVGTAATDAEAERLLGLGKLT